MAFPPQRRLQAFLRFEGCPGVCSRLALLDAAARPMVEAR